MIKADQTEEITEAQLSEGNQTFIQNNSVQGTFFFNLYLHWGGDFFVKKKDSFSTFTVFTQVLSIFLLHFLHSIFFKKNTD